MDNYIVLTLLILSSNVVPWQNKMLILVLLLSSICICLADFKAEVEEGPGTFLNTVPDGWFKNGEEGEAAGKIFFDILK